jgi:polyphosphate kinase
LKKELRVIFDTHLSDQCSAWDMQSDGRYLQRIPGFESAPCGSHYLMIERTVKRLKESLKQKKKVKSKTKAQLQIL